jgi:hypothetical protein
MANFIVLHVIFWGPAFLVAAIVGGGVGLLIGGIVGRARDVARVPPGGVVRPSCWGRFLGRLTGGVVGVTLGLIGMFIVWLALQAG